MCIITIFINPCFRVDRAQRLKDARREALEEIEELKRKKNEELIEYEKKVIYQVYLFIFIYNLNYYVLYQCNIHTHIHAHDDSQP